jgi:O-antigen/teichoic acid export membrane protein
MVQALAARPSGLPWSQALNAGLIAGASAGLLAAVAALAILPASSPQFAVLLHDPAYLVAFLPGVALWSVADLLDAAYLAERRAGRVLVRNACTTASKNLFLLLLLPFAGLGALSVFGASMLGSGAGAFIGLRLVRGMGRDYRPALRGIAGQARGMVKQTIGHHLTIVGGLAPTYLLPVLVTARLSAADNAYFYATWMLGSIFFMISPAVAASLFAEGARGSRHLDAALGAATRIISALLVPVMLVFLLGGGLILGAFGPDYARHGLGLLSVLVISAVPDAITNVYVAMLRVRQRFREATLLNLGMAALTLALAWPLLSIFGIAGAGWAWMIAQSAGSLIVGVRLGLARAPRLRVVS